MFTTYRSYLLHIPWYPLLKNFLVQRTLSLRAMTRRRSRSRLFYFAPSDFTSPIVETQQLRNNQWLKQPLFSQPETSSLPVDDTPLIELSMHTLLYKRSYVFVFARERIAPTRKSRMSRANRLSYARKTDGAYHERRR